MNLSKGRIQNFFDLFIHALTYCVIAVMLSACALKQANYDDTKISHASHRGNHDNTIVSSQDKLAEQVFPTPSIISRSPSESAAPPLKTVEPPSITGTPLSLNLDAEKLPRGFRGDYGILTKLFDRLSKISKKDEYESKTDYINRLKSEINDHIYAFVPDPSRLNFLNSVDYNADNEVLSVKVSMLDSRPTAALIGLDIQTIISAKSYKRIQLSSKYTSLDDYIGSNAFGHKVLVSKASFDNYGLAVANQIKIDVLGKVVQVKLSPRNARALGKDVGIVLICKLHTPEWPEPLAYNDYSHSKPTIDSPTDVLSVYHLIVVDLYQIWIYDRGTGQILRKEIVNQ